MNKSSQGVIFVFSLIVLSMCFSYQVFAYSGTVNIYANGGGNCNLVGNWDDTTKICVLTDDISGSINVGGNTTLDGNGHALTNGLNIRTGLSAGSGATIKNLSISNFIVSIVLQRVSSVVIDNVQIFSSGSYGLFMQGGSGNKIINSTFSGGYQGIWTDSGDHTISGNTFENILTSGVRLYFQNASNILIEKNIFDTNNYGIYAEFNTNNVIKNNTFKNNIGPGYYESNDGNHNNLIIQNNFIDNGLKYNQGQTSYWVYSTFSQDLPIGGNYWSDFDTPEEGCIDGDSNGICDAARIINFFNKDFLPWTTIDGWVQKVEPQIYYSKITNTPEGVAKLYELPDTNSTLVKTLPNDWIVKVVEKTINNQPIISGGYHWYKVEDPTDNTNHYMVSGLDSKHAYLPYNKEKQVEYEKISSEILDTKDKRVSEIETIINHYFANTDTSKSLYSSNDHTRKISHLSETGFPKELILAIIAQEISVDNFNNENVSFDYGHGLTQVTMHTKLDYTKNSVDPRGEMSEVRLSRCKNVIRNDSGTVVDGSNEYIKCYEPIYNSSGKVYKNKYSNYEDILTNPIYKQYANTIQSMYANIKDGLGVLESKNGRIFPHACSESLVIASYTITCSELNIIKSVWGYNGAVLDPKINYLRLVADRLKNLSTYFPNNSYGNENLLIEKMKIANNNRIEIKAHSPVEVRIKDSASNIVGLLNGQSIVEIPGGVYDPESERAVVFFPDDTYTYEVLGDATGGIYGVDIDIYNNSDVPVSFSATDLPILSGEIHTYSIDEAKLENGNPNAVTIKIDTNGDGITDKTIKTGPYLSGSDIPYDFEFQNPTISAGSYSLSKILPIHIKVKTNNKEKDTDLFPEITLIRISDSYSFVLENKKNADVSGGTDFKSYVFKVPKDTLTEGQWRIEVNLGIVTHSIIINIVK